MQITQYRQLRPAAVEKSRSVWRHPRTGKCSIGLSLSLFVRFDPSYPPHFGPLHLRAFQSLRSWSAPMCHHPPQGPRIPHSSTWSPANINVECALSNTNAENTFNATAVHILPIGPIDAWPATALSSGPTSSSATREHVLAKHRKIHRRQDRKGHIIAASGSRKPATLPSHVSAACRRVYNAVILQARLQGTSRTLR